MKRHVSISLVCVLAVFCVGCGGGPSKGDVKRALLNDEGYTDRPWTFEVPEGRQNLNRIGESTMAACQILEEAGYLTIEEKEAGECIFTVTEEGRKHGKRSDLPNRWDFILRTAHVKSIDEIIMEEDGRKGEVIWTQVYKPASKYTEAIEKALKHRREDIYFVPQFKSQIGLHGPDQVWHIYYTERYYPQTQ